MTKQMTKKIILLMVVSAAMLVGLVPVVQGFETDATPIPSATRVEATTNAPIEAMSEATAAAYDNPYADIPFSRTEDGAPVLGNPDAPITIIEFADFACPFCQRYEPTMQQFITEYVATGRAQYEFRYLPTAGGEMTAYVGSLNSCFEDQRPGVFWPLHDAIYAQAKADHYDTTTMKKLARQFDLNFLDAQVCMSEHIDNLQVDIDVALAHSLEVGGTPAIRVRYKDHNDGQAQYLVVDGQVYDKGGPALVTLAQAVADAEAGKIPDAEITPDVPLMPGEPV